MANLPINLPLCTHRYLLMVSYIGTKYLGSQRLINRNSLGKQNTIQEALECALEDILPKKRCRLTAASRTDRGVHALMNCFSMPLMDFNYPTEKLKRLVNTNLFRKQHEIVVNELILGPAEFHPRKSAVGREYIYRIGVPKLSHSRSVRANYGQLQLQPELFYSLPASELFRILPVPKLDMQKVEEAINVLKGIHDFASFCFNPAEDDDTVRSLEIDIIHPNEMTFAQEISNPIEIVHLHFKSRSFLHNQVRRLVGAILSYACVESVGLQTIKQLLEKPDSSNWGANLIVAEPWGLYLSRVNYDKSSLEGTIRTHEDDATECTHEEQVHPESIVGVIDMSDEQICQRAQMVEEFKRRVEKDSG